MKTEYACHVEKPISECVFAEGYPKSCDIAESLHAQGKTHEVCPFWRPVKNICECCGQEILREK